MKKTSIMSVLMSMIMAIGNGQCGEWSIGRLYEFYSSQSEGYRTVDIDWAGGDWVRQLYSADETFTFLCDVTAAQADGRRPVPEVSLLGIPRSAVRELKVISDAELFNQVIAPALPYRDLWDLCGWEPDRQYTHYCWRSSDGVWWNGGWNEYLWPAYESVPSRQWVVATVSTDQILGYGIAGIRLGVQGCEEMPQTQYFSFADDGEDLGPVLGVNPNDIFRGLSFSGQQGMWFEDIGVLEETGLPEGRYVIRGTPGVFTWSVKIPSAGRLVLTGWDFVDDRDDVSFTADGIANMQVVTKDFPMTDASACRDARIRYCDVSANASGYLSAKVRVIDFSQATTLSITVRDEYVARLYLSRARFYPADCRSVSVEALVGQSWRETQPLPAALADFPLENELDTIWRGGIVTGSGTYREGETVVLKAETKTTQVEFAGWKVCSGMLPEGTDLTNPTLTFHVGPEMCGSGSDEKVVVVRPCWRFAKSLSWGNGDESAAAGLYGADKLAIGADEIAPYKTGASVYDGYLRDAKGNVAGTIQLKVAKGKTDKKTGKFSAKVTATVQLVDGSKKISFKNGVADELGNVTGLTAAGHSLDIKLGVDGLVGAFDGTAIDGARNLFSAKDVDSKAVAAAMEAKWLGAINIVTENAVLAVTIAKKGKVKVSGTVDGVKVSASSQLLIGEANCCIPVVITKKVNLAFNIWLGADGSVEVVGLAGVKAAGKAGTLKAGAKFLLGAAVDMLAAGLPGLYRDYLPEGFAVAASGTKWIVADGVKAGKVAFAKGTTVIDETKLGANPSGLKLTYKAKDGSFKGSFKAYNLEKDKIKSYTVNVTGVMIGTKGYGTATIKKPLVSCSVEIE